MLSRREILSVFVALAITVVVILSLFVLPGVVTPSCSRDVRSSSSPEHWFCAEIVRPNVPGPCQSAESTTNGASVTTMFEGYFFHVYLFTYCINIANLELNASVIEPGQQSSHVTLGSGLTLYFDWINWTTPDNQSGLQWMTNDTLALLATP